MRFLIFLISLISPILLTFSVNAATLRGGDFFLQTDVTPHPTPPPSSTLLPSSVQTGFAEVQNAKPIRLSLSTDLVDFGPMTPTNPIKREINMSVDPGSSIGIFLLVSENHPLKSKDATIPDTTCDTGACSEELKDLWINPFTFGFGFSLLVPVHGETVQGEPMNRQSEKGIAPEGFSFDDNLYQQFADTSKKEEQTAIDPGKITIKLNVSQNQPPATYDNPYENTLLFLAIPKL